MSKPQGSLWDVSGSPRRPELVSPRKLIRMFTLRLLELLVNIILMISTHIERLISPLLSSSEPPSRTS